MPGATKQVQIYRRSHGAAEGWRRPATTSATCPISRRMFCAVPRDGSAFALGASRLLGAARLRFTLNSLSADFIACSFALLGEDGCLCEIGSKDIWSGTFAQLGEPLSPYVQYIVFSLETVLEQTPAWMNDVLRLLVAPIPWCRSMLAHPAKRSACELDSRTAKCYIYLFSPHNYLRKCV